MKLREIVEILEAEIFYGHNKLDCQVYSACGCDLMSDVLSYAKEDILLLTGLNNPHVIRTAEMAGIYYIAFVRGKQPTQEVIQLARILDIALLSTKLPLYEACGKLYEGGLGR